MIKEIDSIESKVLLKNKRSVIKVYLFSKLVENDIQFYEAELEMLVELYMRNGYSTKDEMLLLYNWTKDNKYRNAIGSFHNFITKFVNSGVILKQGRLSRAINPEFIPPTPSDNVAVKQLIINIDNLN